MQTLRVLLRKLTTLYKDYIMPLSGLKLQWPQLNRYRRSRLIARETKLYYIR
jgi:hypothetical protein